ncbi:hypothetical protein EK21DRAFT_87559 [Setomelanomma holmii]|uniref:Uncharacterized protein n=1 Tax=Setomelanomma holmii TaxID=210430 RepID=A0A9P4HDA9_9PLEO|nr:hypothetical protein EK21DRAFT_87559 [Setomelanomma holmii]
MVLITICTLLSSETVYLTGEGETCGVKVGSEADVKTDRQVKPRMRLALAWVLGVVLVVVAVVTVFMIRRLSSRPSGVHAEPSTIAGVACLYGDDLARQFPRTFQDPSARYRLNSSGGIETNAIVASASQFQPSVLGTRKSGNRYGHPAMHPAVLTAFWFFLIGVLILVVYYSFVSKPKQGGGLKKFMNSNSYGVRLFMPALSLLISSTGAGSSAISAYVNEVPDVPEDIGSVLNLLGDESGRRALREFYDGEDCRVWKMGRRQSGLQNSCIMSAVQSSEQSDGD